ncbi:MAG: uncharacterized protein PWR13_1095 [Archaeoglobi archaeon]|nr:uncharacterized protein [Archaeoglobi archaeon]
MMNEDPENIIKGCVDILNQIINDDTVPKNIRRSAEKAKEVLEKGVESGKDSYAIRAASAISILDEVGNDPNIPLHARTLIWNIVSQLERIPVE